MLGDDNPHRRELIDQVTGTALPETKNPDEVSTTVKAFMAAQLPTELIGLLEKLVLGGGEFAANKNLQNLLILTAIRCAHEPGAPEGRAMEYIHRLDNFDGKEIAAIALREEYQLAEEAYTIYAKFGHHAEAVGVLLVNLSDIDRAAEYAARVNDKEVWTILARAQLEANAIKDAVDSYIRAGDATDAEAVIRAGEREGRFDDLVRFLEMARKAAPKDRALDSALVYALAQTKRLGELEAFVTSPNVADLQASGDRCFDEGLFEAARILFTAVGNNGKLASTLIALGLYREAVDAAKKANSIRVWKEVRAREGGQMTGVLRGGCAGGRRAMGEHGRRRVCGEGSCSATRGCGRVRGALRAACAAPQALPRDPRPTLTLAPAPPRRRSPRRASASTSSSSRRSRASTSSRRRTTSRSSSACTRAAATGSSWRRCSSRA